jgi:hypothetical protein
LASFFSNDVANDELIAAPNNGWMRSTRAAQWKINGVNDVCGHIDVGFAVALVAVDSGRSVIVVNLFAGDIFGSDVAVMGNEPVVPWSSVTVAAVVGLADSTLGREQTGGTEAHPQSANEKCSHDYDFTSF